MSSQLETTSKWIYQGVWKFLGHFFVVPQTPPSLPVEDNSQLRTFRPSRGFLRYLKVKFWVLIFLIEGGLVIGWLAILVANPTVAIVASPIELLLIIVPAALGYLAIHLQFDTTWYLLSDRSMRLRRGIWIIRETTITFENIQNVAVRQGPLQRLFGISDVVVETAGGAGAVGQKTEVEGSHVGLLEGVDNPAEIRDLIMMRLRNSKSAGLGDEPEPVLSGNSITPEHVAVLREIRDLVRT